LANFAGWAAWADSAYACFDGLPSNRIEADRSGIAWCVDCTMSWVRQVHAPTHSPPHRERSDGRAPSSSARIAILLFLALLASGCTSPRQWWHNGCKVGPDYARPPGPVASTWVDAADPRVKSEPANDCAWWTAFNDPTLNTLIETAYRQNLDLRTAGTRILEARAQRNIAVGNLFPQTQTAVGTYAHAQISQNLNVLPPGGLDVWATGFNASWELDFWGRFRRMIESNNADLEATAESYRDTLVLLLSDVATNYVQMRTFEERLALARHNVVLQKGSAQLADQRFTNGVASELDLRQALANLAQTEALIPPLEVGRRQAANRLCILMGMPVLDLSSRLSAAPIPKPPMSVAVGIPADLLRRRPDIRRAEREVASQCAQIGIAEADYYPRFTINGFLGYASNDTSTLFEPRSFLGFVIPNFQWNVLNYGRITNNVRVQVARLEGATYRYQQTVLTAGREVEDSLVAFLQAQQQAARLEESVRENERSVELVILQFQGGVTDFNRVYTTQSAMVTQQDQWASTRGNIAINLINVYRSLGGGWQYFVNPPTPGVVQPAEEVRPPDAPVERLPTPILPPQNQ
jgi:NodT family efflux transporter outer membrane factor (OMF) lipoprotein